MLEKIFYSLSKKFGRVFQINDYPYETKCYPVLHSEKFYHNNLSTQRIKSKLKSKKLWHSQFKHQKSVSLPCNISNDREKFLILHDEHFLE